jgi:hypothetical protein
MASRTSSDLGQVKESLRCPVCLCIRSGKIFACLNGGHIICELCYDHLDRKICPTCRGNYSRPPTRNWALERLIVDLGPQADDDNEEEDGDTQSRPGILLDHNQSLATSNNHLQQQSQYWNHHPPRALSTARNTAFQVRRFNTFDCTS